MLRRFQRSRGNGTALAKRFRMSSFDALFAYDIIAEPLGLWFLTREVPTSELVTQAAPTMRPGAKFAHQQQDRDTLFASVPTIDLAQAIEEQGLFEP